jgi:hypothetical protein
VNIIEPSAEIISIHGYLKGCPGFDTAGMAALRFFRSPRRARDL